MKVCKFQIVVQVILACAFLSSCKDDAPENPCANAQEVKADFVIEELVGKRYFLGDTVNGLRNQIRFTALQDADEYIWTLGAETIKTKSFYRTLFPDGWVDIKLVIKRKPNLKCFPKDDGVDSSARKFYCWPMYASVNMELVGPYYPIYGTYRGHYINDPSFEFDVTIRDTLWEDSNHKPHFIGILRGLPVSYFKTDEVSGNVGLGYICPSFSPKALQIQFGGLGGPPRYRIPRMFGYAWLERSDPGKINIQYVFQDTINYARFSDTLFFTGIKIP